MRGRGGDLARGRVVEEGRRKREERNVKRRRKDGETWRLGD